LPEFLTVVECLELYSDLKGLDRASTHLILNDLIQLFKLNDLTGQPLIRENREYGIEVPQLLANKCRLLRSRLNALGKRIQDMPGGSFGQVTKTAKLSQLYRRMHRSQVDSMMPGPPAYFTRRRDGIPIPPLTEFMKGYDNLFKLNIPSKTLEASFLLLNRQIWTNAKERHIDRGGEGEEAEDGGGGGGTDAPCARGPRIPCTLCLNAQHIVNHSGRHSVKLLMT
jgi:hypothetical protein